MTVEPARTGPARAACNGAGCIGLIMPDSCVEEIMPVGSILEPADRSSAFVLGK